MTSRSDLATAARASAAATRRGTWQGLDQANIMSLELLAAIGTWTAIGWLVDRWLGTPPWFLAIGALVGNAAGIYLVWLRSGRMEGNPNERRFGGTPASDLAPSTAGQPGGDAGAS